MRLLRLRGVPMLLLAVIVSLDATIRLTSPRYAVLGVLDEPAHLATAAIALAAMASARELPVAMVISGLACSVLLDADHVPQVLGWQGLTDGTPRPYSHSLLTVAVLALASAIASWRRPTLRAVLAGASIGVALHLWRDLGTGSVSLFWPISLHGFMFPYLVYLSPVVLLAAWCGSRQA